MCQQRHLAADCSTAALNSPSTDSLLLSFLFFFHHSLLPFHLLLLFVFPVCFVSLREEEDDDIAHQFCCPASECSSPSSR
uniref:Uncharacterized protein n=1 Tax=Mola mola TaxID=94237 RepID=A0A3Q3WKB8_MOLML